MTTSVANYPQASQSRGALFFPATLAAFALITRWLCRGPVYFLDGPAHIESIVEKVYVIQPPGYWLFNRIAGLFPDPALAIAAMNIFFSVAGIVVFYYTAGFFTTRKNAFLASLAYSTIFYLWFTGEIHSTYASQILFPVATFFALLCYDRDRAQWQLGLAALLFALGAGIRPSDGVFMIPMVLYFALFRIRRKESLIFLSLIAFLCLAWIVPTWLAFHQSPHGMHFALSYTSSVLALQFTLKGANLNTLANITRYGLPLLVAFWPVLGIAALHAVRHWKDWRVKALLLWIAPGSLFFALFFISDTTYLTFLSAAILLLAAAAPRRLAVTALWNAVLFLAISPIPSQRLAASVVNCYVLKYTLYGIRHQWQPRLIDLEKKAARHQ